MHPSYVDIENEFSEIEREVTHLSVELASIDSLRPAPDTQQEWSSGSVCASAAEKIYTGCERIMARIASEFDGVPVAHSESWHMAVLRRMANTYPERRGPIISAKCYLVMDKLRAFRHRERNTYGINLDFEIVVERATEAVAGFELFRHEVRVFFGQGNDDKLEDGPAPGPAPR